MKNKTVQEVLKMKDRENSTTMTSLQTNTVYSWYRLIHIYIQSPVS